MVNFINDYYKYRESQLMIAIDNYTKIKMFYGTDETSFGQSAKLNVVWQEILLEFYKGVFGRWIK